MALILVVEDEKNIARAVKDKLEKAGYSVDSVNSGTDAFNYLAGVLPDLIILDVLMPDISGYEVVRKIRAEERTRHIPVMLLTVLPEEEKEADLEVDAWLTKPYKGVDLLHKVNDLLKDS